VRRDVLVQPEEFRGSYARSSALSRSDLRLAWRMWSFCGILRSDAEEVSLMSMAAGGSATRWGPLFGAHAVAWAETWEGPAGWGTPVYEHVLDQAEIGSGSRVLDCGSRPVHPSRGSRRSSSPYSRSSPRTLSPA
jgi:hypothetical protein